MSVTFQGLAPLVVSAVEDDSDEAPTHMSRFNGTGQPLPLPL